MPLFHGVRCGARQHGIACNQSHIIDRAIRCNHNPAVLHRLRFPACCATSGPGPGGANRTSRFCCSSGATRSPPHQNSSNHRVQAENPGGGSTAVSLEVAETDGLTPSLEASDTDPCTAERIARCASNPCATASTCCLARRCAVSGSNTRNSMSPDTVLRCSNRPPPCRANSPCSARPVGDSSYFTLRGMDGSAMMRWLPPLPPPKRRWSRPFLSVGIRRCFPGANSIPILPPRFQMPGRTMP